MVASQPAQQVGDVLQVVAMAEPRHRVRDDRLRLVRAQAHGTTDAHVLAGEGCQVHRTHALGDIGLDEAAAFAVGARALAVADQRITDIQRRVRPGRLREVLDGGGEAARAFDQQHVGRLQAGRQAGQVGRRAATAAPAPPGEVAGQPVAKPRLPALARRRRRRTAAATASCGRRRSRGSRGSHRCGAVASRGARLTSPAGRVPNRTVVDDRRAGRAESAASQAPARGACDTTAPAARRRGLDAALERVAVQAAMPEKSPPP